MTVRDRWKKRPAVLKYFAFRDEVKLRKIMVPEASYWIVFIIQMPASWSVKKKLEMDGKPHQQTPDKDNLEKGLLDAIYGEDCAVWHGGCEKRWGRTGKIIVRTGIEIS
jgi:Holliday junction resolvase RusA-like endonuclease